MNTPPVSSNPAISTISTIQASDGQHTIQLRRLSLSQLRKIDHLLEQLDGYGELRLKVEKGNVRFVEVVVSRKL